MGNKVEYMVTKKIIDKLNKGIIPWHKPWFAEPSFNRKSMKPYTGVNVLLLDKAGEYATFKQWTELGGTIKKGAKSEFVVFYTDFTKKIVDEETGDEMEQTFPCLRYYNVFHIDDVEGVEPLKGDEIPTFEENRNAEALLHNYWDAEGIKIVTGTKKASYYPETDELHLPAKETFDGEEEYYSTAFHESVHSTGNVNRLKRKFGLSHKSKTYSFEELIAEIGAAMLMSKAGLETDATLTNSAAYIQGWVSYLDEHKEAITKAAGKAKKAVEYISQYTTEADAPAVETAVEETTEVIEEVAEATTEIVTDDHSFDDVTVGMRFKDSDGKIFTVTKLSDMSVELSNGEISSFIYDFGTARKVKDIEAACFGKYIYEAKQDPKKPFDVDNPIVTVNYITNSGKGKMEIDLRKILTAPKVNTVIDAFKPQAKSVVSKFMQTVSKATNADEITGYMYEFVKEQFDTVVYFRDHVSDTKDRHDNTVIASKWKDIADLLVPYGHEALVDEEVTEIVTKKSIFYIMAGRGDDQRLESKKGITFEKGGYTFNAYKNKQETIITIDGTGMMCKQYTGAISAAPDMVDDKLLGQLEKIDLTQWTELYEKLSA